MRCIHGGADHGFAAFGQAFVVFAESSILPELGEGPFDDPSVRGNFEPLLTLWFLNDLQRPTEPFLEPLDERSAISSISFLKENA
jgi:hypothetical protein